MIDTSRKHDISEVVDVDLSREEDSVTSLAVSQSLDTSATVLAGINSSSADQQAGKNEHLRSFRLGYPPRRRGEENSADTADKQVEESKGGTVALGKVALFSPSSAPKKETYQRVLRLSPAEKDNGARLGVVATGLAQEGEVVIFDASKSSPSKEDILGRIRLGKGEEAADVDIIGDGEGGYHVAYCTDYEIYFYDIPADSKHTPSEPKFLHGTPHPDVFASSNSRPKYRSLRFLTPSLILLLQNQPDRKGAELHVLEVKKSIPLGTVILRKRLHKSIKSATALATAVLPPATNTQNVQNVIAIAGQDISITVLTMDHSPYRRPSTALEFRTHCILRSVHPLQMTALTISAFTLPSESPAPLPQYLKLASVSMASTVIVHTFPLRPYPTPSRNSKAKPRYVLSVPGAGETAQFGLSVLAAVLMVALTSVLLQAWTEIRGGTPEYLGAKGWLSQRVHDYIARPYMFENDTISTPATSSSMPNIEEVGSMLPSMNDMKDKVPDVEDIHDRVPSMEEMRETVQDTAENIKDSIPTTDEIQTKFGLRSLLSQHPRSSASNDPSRKAIIVRDTGTSLSADLHDHPSTIQKEAKRWEELNEHEQRGWKQRLVDAGEWAVEEGEAVLKGVFFGQIAGVVGEVVRGA